MTRSKVSLFLLIVLLATAINATAQPMDRPALLSKIESQREQLRAKEAAFLLPSEEDFASFRDFLLQPDTGLVRLMPREKYDGEMLIRGGGAYYSFVKLTNAYGGGSDIALEQETLRTGFAGADFGFLTVIGDVPLDGISLDQPGVRYLAALNTPTTESEAREQQRRSSLGVEADGFFLQKLSVYRRQHHLRLTFYQLRGIRRARGFQSHSSRHRRKRDRWLEDAEEILRPDPDQ